MENTFSNIIYLNIFDITILALAHSLMHTLEEETTRYKGNIINQDGHGLSACPSNLVWQWTIKWVNLTQVLRWPTEQHDNIYDRACGKVINGHYNVLVASKYGRLQ